MSNIKKLLDRFSDFRPGRRIFFIYTHHNYFDRFHYGMKANTEISFWSIKALKEHFPRVTFLKLEKEKPEKIERIKPDDVVIGHIGETYLKAAQKTKKIIAFYPWSGHQDRSLNMLFNCLPLEKERLYLNLSASIIWLTSEFNVKEYAFQKKNFWFEDIQELKKNKRFHFVHQPLDLNFFKRVKFEYKSSNFVYIGNDAHMKGLKDGISLAEKLERKLHLYGIGERRFDHLNKANILNLANEADFFLQPGMWEAQCVSILEAAARGFIPVVTPETGYPYHHPFLLKYGDNIYNERVLKKLLKTAPEERKILADDLHAQLVNDVNHNQWTSLTNVLIQEVSYLYG